MKCVYTIPVMVIFMYQLGMSMKGQENTGSIDFGETNFQWVGKFANMESVNNNEDWLHPTGSVSVVDTISFEIILYIRSALWVAVGVKFINLINLCQRAHLCFKWS